tara:strand:+ start:4103 stop:4396 length:294 start_codon:yes stop_codon:yes gene_type:complete
MALTKETEISKIEVVDKWNIQVKVFNIIKEDGVEISRTAHRHVLQPFTSIKNSDDTWTHTATDISNEDDSVQAIANAAWTTKVKNDFKNAKENQLDT